MLISLETVALNLNIKLVSLFKVMSRNGFSRTLFLSANDTQKFINCLEINQSCKRVSNRLKLINALKDELSKVVL